MSAIVVTLGIATLSLSMAVGILIYMIYRTVNEIVFLREDLQQASDNEHAKCIAAVAAYIGNEWAAQILEVAAEDYSSPKAHADIERIQRLVWRPEGEPVPAIWLRERATKLRVDADWGQEASDAAS